MKNPERVAQLLAELRELADNDFELHRIDVLERDLTAPPQVEQIDDKHQRFDGITYTKNKSGHYSKSITIHQAIWQYYCGDIPAAHVIHHVDFNPENNSFQNLILTTKREHHRIHSQFDKRTKQGCCLNCGKTFATSIFTTRPLFCSKKCWKAYTLRRYQEMKNCPVCGKSFYTYRYKPNKTCSRECAAQLKLQQTREPQICPVCGKSFLPKKSRPQKCCSHSCAATLMWKKHDANR